MSSAVIDASVLIKIYLEELNSSEAERFIKTADNLFAPDLLLPESANVLWKYVRRGALSPADADRLLDDIQQMPINFTASTALVQPALRIAAETDRTVYDCLYLALAIQTNTVLITADERLIHALADTPYSGHLRHVSGTES